MDPQPNHFTLFGLPPSFELDAPALEARYLALQRETHPDRFALADDAERRRAVERNAAVNAAYRTLKDPLLRARHLLTLAGIGFGGEQDRIHDTAFLMEQMALREAIETAREAVNPHEHLETVAQELRVRSEALLVRLAGHFARPEPERLARAREDVLKLQFFQRLHEAAQALETELEEM